MADVARETAACPKRSVRCDRSQGRLLRRAPAAVSGTSRDAA